MIHDFSALLASVNRSTTSLLNSKIILFYVSIILSIQIIPDLSYCADCLNTKFLFDVKPNVDQPSDIAIGPNGDVYLVDGVNHRVIVFDSDGKQKLTFGRQGADKGEFKYPLGIDIAEDGKVFIADTGNHRIQAFDLKGNFLQMFTIKSSPEEKPADPVDVLVSKLKGYLYVSDNNNHKIRVFNQRGQFEFEWGKFGEGPGEFRYPGILAANEFNQIFVVDVLNTRVQAFDPFGKYISDIGAWGVLPGKLFRPKGVAIDKKNRVFVSDSYMGLIQVFTGLGRFLGVICENNLKRQLITPVGMVMDNNRKRLHVVEMRANKISIIEILN
jgi:DNA-binding beta-propeller fold protein YncE